MRILPAANAVSYVGPFIIDRTHPLAEGLSLQGVVWGADRSEEQFGSPVITAGNVPLIGDLRRLDGSHELQMRFKPEASTLQQSPAWPVLMWNLVTWRASELPGFSRPNLPLGAEATLKLDSKTTRAEVRDPSGEQTGLVKRDGIIALRADRPGVYTAETGTAKYQFAANALNRQETDLRNSTSASWGGFAPIEGPDSRHRSLSWVFLLLALLLLALHLAILASARPQPSIQRARL
jgi:hypothetical protein